MPVWLSLTRCRPYLIGTVHIHIGSKKGLQRVNDNQTAEDGLGDTVKPRLLSAEADLERVLVIDDADHPLTLADERIENAIRENNARLKNHIEWFKWLHLGQKLSIGAGCRKLHGKEGFALTGVSLNDR